MSISDKGGRAVELNADFKVFVAKNKEFSKIMVCPVGEGVIFVQTRLLWIALCEKKLN